MSSFDIIGTSQHSTIDALLNAFHQAAAIGDLAAFFSCFECAEKSRFLGTDVNENWTAGEFMEFARPHFKNDGTPAWIYIPIKGKRVVDHFYDNEIATFDEHLISESFKATSRGSGSCVRNKEGHWHFIQYYLSFPIPNVFAKVFCSSIAKWEMHVSTDREESIVAQVEIEAKVAVEKELRKIKAANTATATESATCAD